MYLKKYVRTLVTQSVVLGAFLGLFSLGLPLASASTLPTGGTINNQAPSAPSTTDNSSRAAPTNVGTAVTFTSTSTDPNGEQYYLAICKTAAVTAGTDGPPTCTGGGWGTTNYYSTATNSGSPATVSYTTLVGDTEESNWFAYACDKVASGALCNVTADSTNSPFATNHRPSYSSYAATDSTGGSIEPGENIKFAVTTADTDTLGSDTVAVFVCPSGNTFNGTNCSGTELCHVTATAPGAVSCTTVSTPVPVPTAAGSTNVEVFVVDNHSFVGNGASTQTYTVSNVAPTISASTQYTVSNITLVAGSSVAPSYSVIVTDNNGGSTISGATGVLYDDDAINLASGTCSSNEKNCYPGVTCSAGTATGADRTFTCAFTVWFNADFSDSALQDWRLHANPTDGTNSPTSLTDSNAIQVGALSAINVSEASIAYGSLALGADSTVQTTTIQNQGNTVIDVWVSGTDMTSGSNSIPKAQQHYHQTSSSFTWGTGDFALVATASAGTETTGCLNRDLAVRAVHGTGTEDEPIYWRLRVPSSQASGTYAGLNTFAYGLSTSCTGTLY